MEPVSILLATGAIAVYAAHRAEKLSEKARRGPVTLPEIISAPNVEDAMSVQVLAVHIRSAHLSRQHFFNDRLKVRVKYGEPGASIHCDTEEAVASPPEPSPAARFVARLPHLHSELEPVTADFGTTCLFLGQRNGENIIRIRVMKAGLFGRTIAKADLRISTMNQLSTWQDYDLPLYRYSDDYCQTELGKLDVAVETRVMPKGDLRQYLSLLGARKQHEAFFMGIMPVTEGQVSEASEVGRSQDAEPIVQGEFLGMRPARRRRDFFGFCSRRAPSHDSGFSRVRVPSE
eukprot:TRINITY_DN16278_c0_g1_i1.p1 TRINITY_DN16278_c0_g1~~TRINITY_DN16278_c0_g1_i1.p1  ORF type:complete len:289 (+),score=41.13 TRINITY_DN16278_c0_g1_i1:115-981(+)